MVTEGQDVLFDDDMMRRSPCMGSAVVLAAGSSSNHVGRMDLTPFFFPSNARWLSPGRLSSRKDNCILQIHRIRAVATSVMMTMCIQKGTEKDRYIIH